jgi:hypothetical protein
VREVDQLEDAVDERITERDERVESSLRDTDQKDSAEVVRRLDEVDAEPREDDQDKQDSDGPRYLRADIAPRLDWLNVRLGDQIRLPLKTTGEGP